MEIGGSFSVTFSFYITIHSPSKPQSCWCSVSQESFLALGTTSHNPERELAIWGKMERWCDGKGGWKLSSWDRSTLPAPHRTQGTDPQVLNVKFFLFGKHATHLFSQKEAFLLCILSSSVDLTQSQLDRQEAPQQFTQQVIGLFCESSR